MPVHKVEITDDWSIAPTGDLNKQLLRFDVSLFKSGHLTMRYDQYSQYGIVTMSQLEKCPHWIIFKTPPSGHTMAPQKDTLVMIVQGPEEELKKLVSVLPVSEEMLNGDNSVLTNLQRPDED